MFIPSPSPIDLTGINHLFYGDVSYGKHNKEVFDMFLPTDEITPTGLVIIIHGGGFVVGDKDQVYSGPNVTDINTLLTAGIAVANINYDLMEINVENYGVLNSLKSCERALKFIKFYSPFFNLNKNKFVLKGSSAGAGAAMWLAYQSDLALPFNPDEIERESTSVQSVVLDIPQATYDTLRWEEVFSFYGYEARKDYDNNPNNALSLHRFYSIDTFNYLYTPNIIAYRKSVDMLQFIKDNGGVPTWLDSRNPYETELNATFTLNDLNHNSWHGETIRDYLLNKGTEIVSNVNGISGDNTGGESSINFIIRQLA